MEERNKKLKCLVAILLMAVVILGGYIIYDKLLSGNNNNSINPSDNNDDIKTNVKIYKDKSYEYTADYSSEYPNKYTEYNTCKLNNENSTYVSIPGDGFPIQFVACTHELKALNGPYINIESSYAEQVNNELKNRYKENAKQFDECAESESSSECRQAVYYTTRRYTNYKNDIYTVIVIYGTQIGSPIILDYKAYSFDLKTGNRITYNEMITRLGYDKTTLLDKEKDAIKKKMDKINTDNYDLAKTCGTVNSPKNCYDIAYKMLEDSIKDDSILYFADEYGKLNIIQAVPYTNLSENKYNAKYVFTIEK